jgi:hypothetical protein
MDFFGNLDLARSLAGIARLGAPPETDKSFASASKRLPPDAREEFKRMSEAAQARIVALEERQKAATDKLKEELRLQKKDFFSAFPQARYLSPRELKRAREVVSAFVLGQEDTDPDIVSTGTQLIVKSGRGETVVATRNSLSDRFIEVCPGEFGGQGRAERRAANAILEIVGAGVQIYDRDGASFFSPSGAKSGRVVSNACHKVEVGKKLREKALKAIYPVMGPQREESRETLDRGEGILINPLEARAAMLENEGKAMREGNLKRYGRKLRGRKAYRAKKAAAEEVVAKKAASVAKAASTRKKNAAAKKRAAAKKAKR